MEKKELTNEEIVEILKTCYNLIENGNNTMNPYFLCNKLSELIAAKFNLFFDFNLARQYIPLFTHENAVIHANANPFDKNGKVPVVWFNNRDLNPSYPNATYYNNQNRLIFLKWLIEQYSK